MIDNRMMNPRRNLLRAILLCALLAAHSPAAGRLTTLYLIGDSTVKNGSGRGDGGLWGWGQVLAEHFDAEKVRIENRALGGRSSRTYLTEGLWQRVLDELRPGDFVLMQFGHNDGGELFASDRPRASLKGTGDESVKGIVQQTRKLETVYTYGSYLRQYIHDAKQKGAYPVVLSPVPRNIWRNGRVLLAEYDYGLWAEQSAKETDVPFVDLNRLIASRYEALGEAVVAKDFFTPTDHTHTTKAGAIENARWVVAGLGSLRDSPFIKLLRPDGPWTKTSLTPRFPLHIELPISRPPDNFHRLAITAPEGNYRVKLSCTAPDAETCTTVKSELRRLQVERLTVKPGETATREFIVNVRTPKLPSGQEVRLKDRERTTEAAAWDDKLTLELLGEPLAAVRLDITPAENAPTIFILGDSTVCDQPAEPWAGWGQMLPQFVRPDVAVANHAESGESLRSALGERRFEKVYSLLKPNDWVLIQFGHNDMKETAPDALDQYAANLRKVIGEIHQRGGKVALVTSMERISGLRQNTLVEYPATMQRVAAELDVPLLDLHARSQQLYRALGEDLHHAFQDGTHHTAYGAYLLAQCVASEIQTHAPELAMLLTADLPPFDISQPVRYAAWRLPPSPIHSDVRPLGD